MRSEDLIQLLVKSGQINNNAPMKGMNRREFQQRMGLALVAAPVVGGASCGPQESSPRIEKPSPGIDSFESLKMTLGEADVKIPPKAPEGENWRYGIGLPFQLASGKAALFCNIKGKRGQDFEAGNDLIVFDSIADGVREIFPIVRNEVRDDPHTGKPADVVKYPTRGGFVPFGAKRPDGSPYPNAGTGFGLNQAIGWPLGGSSATEDSTRYWYWDVQQYRYDGQVFSVESSEAVDVGDLLPEWIISDGGLTNAVPDGDDFLVGMTAAEGSAESWNQAGRPAGAGVMRWQRKSERWVATSFVRITDLDGSFEPSLIRDTDGSLLFCARAGSERGRRRLESRVWRSGDGGESWEQTIFVLGAIGGSPITLNQAADGSPYIAANLFEVLLHPIAERFRPKKDDRGIEYAAPAGREKLCLWPLNQARDGLETPILVRDSVAEFGLAPSGDTWNIDHPSAMTVQLADGGWHNVIAMRICDHAEVREGVDPAPQTGCYVEEILSPGEAIPRWNL